MKIHSRIVRKLLDVRPDEYTAFGWTTGLMFLILFSQILFANFADTAFIKRFGVEYLPEMFLIDAVMVFFVMDLVRGLVGKYSPMALLTRVLVIFAIIEVLCRFLLLFDFSLLYPIMYLLRLQIDAVILIIFWNICNDIFDTRQAKRIFPLVTAGGILGRVCGSFSTNFLTQITNLDNLLFISAGALLLAAVASQRVGQVFPPPVRVPKKDASEKKGWSSPIAGVKEISLLATGSLLFILLAAIRVLPNIVGPIFDYQYSVILAERFPSEAELAQFYGVFRGVLNVISFAVLLFVGKVHTRVGIPNALLFRPSNFFLVFSLLLFRFDILIGIYGRISISILTTAMHNPANNIMINLFPDDFRAKARPILQMVSRAGSIVGSLILMFLKTFIHASYFSIFGLFFVAAWILVTLRLKKNYSSFLLETVLEKQVDLKELEDVDLSVLTQDKKTLDRLLQGLHEEKGEAATLCARILADAHYPKLGEAIISAIQEKELAVRVDLFSLLRPEEARPFVPRLIEMTETAPPWLLPHLVKAVGRLAPGENVDFLSRMCEADQKDVRSEAIVGLYNGGMGEKGYGMLSAWVESDDPEDRLLAVTTVGRTGELRLADRLDAILQIEKDPRVQARTLEAIGLLDVPRRNDRIIPWLEDQNPDVRRAAISAMAIDEEEAITRTIEMLGDQSPQVREAAFERVSGIGKEVTPYLLKSLDSPRRALKDGILRLLAELEVKDLELSQFITSEVRHGYDNLHAIEALKVFDQTPALELLGQHLEDKNDDAVFTVFRILEVEGGGSEMRAIYRGLKAGSREKANALEALENTLHPALSRNLVPLLDDIPIEEKLKVAQKQFGTAKEKSPDPMAVLQGLMDSKDPTTLMCTAYLIGDRRLENFSERLEGLQTHRDSVVQETARQALEAIRGIDSGGVEKAQLSTMDKTVRVKRISIFSDLQVREVAAISSITEERDYPEAEIVVKEGEAGDTLFLIVAGEVSVLQNYGTERETLVNTIREGDYFGEMALFEDMPRANTIRTNADAKFLVLKKHEFERVMLAFPRIPVNICRVFSERIRKSHEKILDRKR